MTDLTFQSLYDFDGNEIRKCRWFGGAVEAMTEACWLDLVGLTTEERLLGLAGGNKWIVRRAIEIYKLNVGSTDAWDYVRHRVAVNNPVSLWSNS